jgi:dienelactone hydrolase
VSDIAATLEVARTLAGASGKVGLMGYCFGGLMTFLTAARRGTDASVVFYGGNTEKHLDEARNIKNPLMMHLGEEDEYISKEAQREIIAALAGNAFAEVFTYPAAATPLPDIAASTSTKTPHSWPTAARRISSNAISLRGLSTCQAATKPQRLSSSTPTAFGMPTVALVQAIGRHSCACSISGEDSTIGIHK